MTPQSPIQIIPVSLRDPYLPTAFILTRTGPPAGILT